MAGGGQIHAGHRQRMHERVQKYGLESLAEHEVLEYLLYFTNARRDTNAAAHALLERFGDLAGVLEASEEELCQVEGVGPASARLLHLMPQVSACYHRSRARDRRRFQTFEQIGRYVQERFRGALQEKVLLICLDKQRRITGVTWLGSGGSVSVELPQDPSMAEADFLNRKSDPDQLAAHYLRTADMPQSWLSDAQEDGAGEEETVSAQPQQAAQETAQEKLHHGPAVPGGSGDHEPHHGPPALHLRLPGPPGGRGV